MYGIFCGRKLPPPIISDVRPLFVYFHTDASNQGAGFIASYDEVPGKSVNCKLLFILK